MRRLILVLAGFLFAIRADALGLGDITVRSALNEQLNAEIKLYSLRASEIENIQVSLASRQDFANAGIERPWVLTRLRFEVALAADGTPIVKVSSLDRIREPFLDFLVDVVWPSGRMLREYTVLLDPPVLMQRRPALVSVPASRAQQPTAVGSAKPVGQQELFPRTDISGVAPGAQVAVVPVDGEYRTQRNDTLWSIASAVRPDAGVTVEQMMLALLRTNPDAFYNGNINDMKAGHVLRIPERGEAESIGAVEAQAEVRRQSEAWNQVRTSGVPVADSPTQATGTVLPTGVAAQPSQAQVKIVTPRAEDTSTAAVAGDAPGAEGETATLLREQLALANEARDTAEQQNIELQSRLVEMEEQVETMQRLLALKDDDLAALQSKLDALQAQLGGDTLVPEEEATLAAPMDVASPPDDVAGPEDETAAATDEATVSAEVDVASSSTDVEVPEAGTAGPLGAMAGSAEGDVAPSSTDVAVPEDGATAAQAEVPDATAVGEGSRPGDVAASTELMAEARSELVAEPVEKTANPYAVPDSPQPEAAVAPAPDSSGQTAAETAQQAAATAPGFIRGLVQDPMALGGIAAAVVLLFGGMVWARRRSSSSDFPESILSGKEAAAVAAVPVASEDTSLISDFESTTVGRDSVAAEVDPLTEADVFLAYKRYGQAEDMLKTAIGDAPERLDLKVKLIEVYAAMENREAFEDLAERVHASLDGQSSALWDKVQSLGAELAPENPLFGGAVHGDDAAVDLTEAVPSDGAADVVEGSGESWPLGADTEEQAVGGAFANQDVEVAAEKAGLEFDLARLSLEEEGVEVDGGEVEEKKEFQDLDFELEALAADTEQMAEELVSEEQAGSLEDLTSLELEESLLDELTGVDSSTPEQGEQREAMGPDEELAVDFDLDVETPEEKADDRITSAGDGVAGVDEVATKLDLARAYIDMGDPEGARGILDEVMNEGNNQQKDDAEYLMARIG